LTVREGSRKAPLSLLNITSEEYDLNTSDPPPNM